MLFCRRYCSTTGFSVFMSGRIPKNHPSVRFRFMRVITIREAIRHNEIHHVILRKPLKLSDRRGASSERQFERRCSLRRLNSADGGSRLRVCPHLQPDKEIIPACRSLRARDAERGQIAPNMGRFQIVPGKQQHHLGRESHPPVRRFDFCDRRSSLLGRLLRAGPQRRAAASEYDNGQKGKKRRDASLGLPSQVGQSAIFEEEGTGQKPIRQTLPERGSWAPVFAWAARRNKSAVRLLLRRGKNSLSKWPQDRSARRDISWAAQSPRPRF